MDRTAQFYAQPSYVGAGFPIFAGARRQRGGSIFGAIKSMFMPLVKSALKRGARAAVGAAANVTNDVIAGKSLKDSVKRHGKRALIATGKGAMTDAIGRFVNPPPPKRRRVQVKRVVKAKQNTKRKGKSNF